MLPNAQRGEVAVVLDRERVLVLNFRALAVAEGVGRFSVFELHKKPLGINEFRALGYAGLLKEDPALTLDSFDGIIIDDDRLTALMEAVTKALELSFNKENAKTNPLGAASATPGEGS